MSLAPLNFFQKLTQREAINGEDSKASLKNFNCKSNLPSRFLALALEAGILKKSKDGSENTVSSA